jgi:hypothetical protein
VSALADHDRQRLGTVGVVGFAQAEPLRKAGLREWP